MAGNFSCWVLTEGLAGTENQCVGLAEAAGLDPVIKRVSLRFPASLTSPWLSLGKKFFSGDSLSPPWPDILIASGRKSIEPALSIKKAAGAQTLLVQIQDPKVKSSLFDFVVVPQHDDLRGKNVLVTVGALHRVTPEKLKAESEKFDNKHKNLSSPRVAVLIGGNSRAHRLTPAVVERLIMQITGLAKQGAQLLITVSRRTDSENRQYMKEKLAPLSAEFWEGEGENPYFSFLEAADYILVTEDSVSMVSEALSTGKPVMTLPLEGGARRLNRFHRLLRSQGYTRPFTGKLESWSYDSPQDMQLVSDKIVSALLERKRKNVGKDT